MFPCPAGCVFSLGRKSSSSSNGSYYYYYTYTTTTRVSEGTLGSFWARFWRCSVLQGHCVSLSGRVRLQPREEEQQQQREQGTNSGTKTGRKLRLLLLLITTTNYYYYTYTTTRVSEGTLGSFWARFWR